jgi:hypothetical protein
MTIELEITELPREFNGTLRNVKAAWVVVDGVRQEPAMYFREALSQKSRLEQEKRIAQKSIKTDEIDIDTLLVTFDPKPRCVNHGAMNRVSEDGLWRCVHSWKCRAGWSAS